MKVGRFSIAKQYIEGKIKWAVMGKKDNGEKVVCFDELRKPKELIFDIEYDACGYLTGFVEWQTGELLQRRISQKMALNHGNKNNPVAPVKKTKNKAKRKMAKQSRKRNR
jgi:hypothetical protein